MLIGSVCGMPASRTFFGVSGLMNAPKFPGENGQKLVERIDQRCHSAETLKSKHLKNILNKAICNLALILKLNRVYIWSGSRPHGCWLLGLLGEKETLYHWFRVVGASHLDRNRKWYSWTCFSSNTLENNLSRRPPSMKALDRSEKMNDLRS